MKKIKELLLFSLGLLGPQFFYTLQQAIANMNPTFFCYIGSLLVAYVIIFK